MSIYICMRWHVRVVVIFGNPSMAYNSRCIDTLSLLERDDVSKSIIHYRDVGMGVCIG